jgi:hypothetical protein
MRLASTRGAGASTARSDHEVLDVTECSGSCHQPHVVSSLILAVGGRDRATLAPPAAGAEVTVVLVPIAKFSWGLRRFQTRGVSVCGRSW